MCILWYRLSWCKQFPCYCILRNSIDHDYKFKAQMIIKYGIFNLGSFTNWNFKLIEVQTRVGDLYFLSWTTKYHSYV